MRPALPVAVVLLLACGRSDPALERAVRDYADALVAAYATSDAAGLGPVATREEADRVRILIDIKSAAKLRLDGRLEELEVVRAEAKGDAATVETRERWRFHDPPLAPGKAPGPELVSRMEMRYGLAREGGRWVVASVATRSSAYELPGAAR